MRADDNHPPPVGLGRRRVAWVGCSWGQWQHCWGWWGSSPPPLPADRGVTTPTYTPPPPPPIQPRTGPTPTRTTARSLQQLYTGVNHRHNPALDQHPHEQRQEVCNNYTQGLITQPRTGPTPTRTTARSLQQLYTEVNHRHNPALDQHPHEQRQEVCNNYTQGLIIDRHYKHITERGSFTAAKYGMRCPAHEYGVGVKVECTIY